MQALGQLDLSGKYEYQTIYSPQALATLDPQHAYEIQRNDAGGYEGEGFFYGCNYGWDLDPVMAIHIDDATRIASNEALQMPVPTGGLDPYFLWVYDVAVRLRVLHDKWQKLRKGTN